MTDQKSRESVLSFSKYCMILGGIWRLELPWHNVVLTTAYRIYSKFVRFFFPLILFSMFAQFILMVTYENAHKDQETIFKQLGYITCLVMVQVGAILCQQPRLIQIISYAMLEEKKIMHCSDEDILLSHTKQLRFCRTCNVVLFAVTTGAGVAILLENFWIRHEISKHNRECNASLEKPFVYELYYYKLDKENHEGLLLMVNALADFVGVCLLMSTKIIFSSCIIFGSSLLRRTQIRLRKLSSYGLKRLVLEHQLVIRFVQNLNHSVKYMILMEYFLNSLNIAAVSVQVMSDINMLASPFLSFGILFVETFVLGWTANEIKVQSLALSDALYDSPWYEQNKRIKKAILTMLVRAQKPLQMTIGPFDAMSTQSALTIIKASYSYITLMAN
ncbi:uncharacterized protein LOC132696962 isoform X2 [Cylas formicarius]|uniref:uncharacterized protein LOC132696962 isoform X2 n=1 Tax=Cylas formicarius TaxID=197179 RepID=UPI002958B7B5|nr:uncharacterized protein LOC132696962 isoform X2 [Cylas formicarius]